MSNLDMTEAIRMLAGDRGISVDSLLQVLVEALATAYKKRQGAAEEVIVGINPENMDITFTAYDVDDDGNWINERDDTPKKDELGRIAAQTFRQVMSQRIREVERDRKFEEYANREGDIVSGIVQKNRYQVHIARPWSCGSTSSTSRAGARRSARAKCAPQGIHRRSSQDSEGPTDCCQPYAPWSHQALVRA